MFQNFFNIWIISGLTFFIHHSLRSTDVKFNSFQFHTHAHSKSAKFFFWFIKVHRYNIFNLILFYINRLKTKICFKTLSILSICIISGQTFFRHHGLRYANTKSNSILFNSTHSNFDLFQVKGQTFSLHHGLRFYYTKFHLFKQN